jgi:predicted metal-dependent phosphotriesterase family hydrolase
VDWINLLQKISLTIHNKVEDNMIYYDKSIIANSWLGFDRADLKTIEEKEKSLDTKLPPSNKWFQTDITLLR